MAAVGATHASESVREVSAFKELADDILDHAAPNPEVP